MQFTKLRRLGDVLLEHGAITEEVLDQALAEQRKTRLFLGALLVSRGMVTRQQLGRALAEQYEVPYFAFDEANIHSQLVRLIPESFARRRKIAPLQLEDKVLRLGMQFPSDMEAISEVELMTGYQVEPSICLASEIDRILDTAFDDRIKAKQTAVDIRFAELMESANSVQEDDELLEDSDAPVIRLAKSILMGAVRSEASDIHLEPDSPQMRVRYRIDGQLHQIMTIPHDSEEALVGRIKVLADMDTAEKRRPQDGSLTIQDDDVRASFRVSCIPCVRGEKVVLRVLDENQQDVRLYFFGDARKANQSSQDIAGSTTRNDRDDRANGFGKNDHDVFHVVQYRFILIEMYRPSKIPLNFVCLGSTKSKPTMTLEWDLPTG